MNILHGKSVCLMEGFFPPQQLRYFNADMMVFYGATLKHYGSNEGNHAISGINMLVSLF